MTEQQLKFNVRQGGLMRCCTDTLRTFAEAAADGSEGEVMPCRYCSSSMIFRDGAWEWNRPNSLGPRR